MHLYRLDKDQRKLARERRRKKIAERDQVFLADVIREKLSLAPSKDVKVLDFGCGRGEMVSSLDSLGYDAYGCDIKPVWEQLPDSPGGKLSLISMRPYRLPFEDDTFDVVFSTSVLEHAQNKEKCFREIHRVLKVDGVSMHLFPGKWYLPYEPHMRIPLVNYFWPHCPRWWITLWVLLRVVYVPKLAPDWKRMAQKYYDACKTNIHYISNRKYRQLSIAVFGNYGSLMDFYIDRSEGGYAKMARKLPFRKLAGWVSSHFRMNFIFQKKFA